MSSVQIEFILYISVVIIIGFILIYKGTLTLIFYFFIQRDKKITEQYFERLLKCINQQTIDEDILFVTFKERNKNLHIASGNDFSPEGFLESFLAYAIDHDPNGNFTKKAKEVINPILQRLKDGNPYSKVNERERRILLSIDDTTKKSTNLAEGEKAAIKHNLDDMAMALEENQNALEKSKKANKWSIPVSIIGVLLTLIFGILQVIQSCNSD